MNLEEISRWGADVITFVWPVSSAAQEEPTKRHILDNRERTRPGARTVCSREATDWNSEVVTAASVDIHMENTRYCKSCIRGVRRRLLLASVQ